MPEKKITMQFLNNSKKKVTNDHNFKENNA
jgi:hypothetical protein